MGTRPDDFPIKVKRALAERVGLRCSRPGCPQVTSGPHTNPLRASNVGVAGHNGIWLCQTCAILVDSDPSPYSVEELRQWKVAAEFRRNEELLGRGDEQEARRKYRSQFCLVPCEYGGRRFYLAWRGPLQDLETQEPPHSVTPDEMAMVYCTLCKLESDPVQPIWASRHSAEAQDVWEVDFDLTKKRRLKSPAAHGADEFLRVMPRREPCQSFCPRCGRISAGTYCSGCGSTVGAPVLLRRCP